MLYNSNIPHEAVETSENGNIFNNIVVAEIGIFVFWGLKSIDSILTFLNLPFMNIIDKYHIEGMVYTITMIYIVVNALSKINKPVWILFYLLSIALLISSFNPNNFVYIKEIITGDLIQCTIPLIAIMSMEKDPVKVLKWLRFSSYFVLVDSLFIPSSEIYKSGQYNYMSLAYSSIACWAVICYFSFKNRNILDIIFTIITGINFFVFGSRGAILCMGGFTLICLAEFCEGISKYFFIFFAALLNLFIVNKFSDIINLICNILLKFNLQSRTLMYLNENIMSDSSGRDFIYSNILRAIAKNPFGYGIGADRFLSGDPEQYAHNMFLELIIDYGVIFGVIISLGILMMYTYMLFKCDDQNYKALFCVFAIPGLIMLMLSGSVYENYHIFVAAAIFINYLYGMHTDNRIIS